MREMTWGVSGGRRCGEEDMVWRLTVGEATVAVLRQPMSEPRGFIPCSLVTGRRRPRQPIRAQRWATVSLTGGPHSVAVF
jgi:hypothetical protein